MLIKWLPKITVFKAKLS